MRRETKRLTLGAELLVDIVERLLNGGDVLCVLVWDIDVELLLHRHHELDEVERVKRREEKKMASPVDRWYRDGALTHDALDHLRDLRIQEREDLLPDEDPAFVALVTRALASSPTLGEAAARIDAATAKLTAAGADAVLASVDDLCAWLDATTP